MNVTTHRQGTCVLEQTVELSDSKENDIEANDFAILNMAKSLASDAMEKASLHAHEDINMTARELEISASSKASFAAHELLEYTSDDLVKNAMVQASPHAKQELNFAAKELVSRVLNCVCSEPANDVVGDHGAVASDFEEHDDVEETILGSGCPLFQDKRLMSMLSIWRGGII